MAGLVVVGECLCGDELPEPGSGRSDVIAVLGSDKTGWLIGISEAKSTPLRPGRWPFSFLRNDRFSGPQATYGAKNTGMKSLVMGWSMETIPLRLKVGVLDWPRSGLIPKPERLQKVDKLEMGKAEGKGRKAPGPESPGLYNCPWPEWSGWILGGHKISQGPVEIFRSVAPLVGRGNPKAEEPV